MGRPGILSFFGRIISRNKYIRSAWKHPMRERTCKIQHQGDVDGIYKRLVVHPMRANVLKVVIEEETTGPRTRTARPL